MNEEQKKWKTEQEKIENRIVKTIRKMNLTKTEIHNLLMLIKAIEKHGFKKGVRFADLVLRGKK